MRTLLRVLQEQEIDWGATMAIGGRLPTERLGRIKALAAQASAGDSAIVLDTDVIGIGVNVAFSMAGARDDSAEVWYGRVQTLLACKGRAASYRRPMNPEDAAAKSVGVVCHWYSKTNSPGNSSVAPSSLDHD